MVKQTVSTSTRELYEFKACLSMCSVPDQTGLNSEILSKISTLNCKSLWWWSCLRCSVAKCDHWPRSWRELTEHITGGSSFRVTPGTATLKSIHAALLLANLTCLCISSWKSYFSCWFSNLLKIHSWKLGRWCIGKVFAMQAWGSKWFPNTGIRNQVW